MQVQGYVVEPELTVYMVKPKDTTYIYQALHAFTECAMKNKYCAQFYSEKSAEEAMKVMVVMRCLAAFLYKGDVVGYVGYTIENPWWMSQEVFRELFVLCVSPSFHGFGRVAAKWMEETAKLNHIPLLETAAALPEDPQLAKNLYMKKQGFTLEYPSFVKILKEGKR